jgi:hypothetical protein
MSDVLGVDADGAELREGDKVKHDFGATGIVTGILRAAAGSGLIDKLTVDWDCSPSEAPASQSSAQHLRKVAAADATIPNVRLTQKHTGTAFEAGTVHRAR